MDSLTIGGIGKAPVSGCDGGGTALRRIAARRIRPAPITTSSNAAAAINPGTTPSRCAVHDTATAEIYTSDTGISSFHPSAMNWS